MDKLKEIEERALVAMAYWLDCSPHEWTVEDGQVIACYARLATEKIEQLKANEEVLMEQNKKLRQQIHSFRSKTTYRVYEENLKLAEELALIKGEMSG